MAAERSVHDVSAGDQAIATGVEHDPKGKSFVTTKAAADLEADARGDGDQGSDGSLFGASERKEEEAGG